MEKIEYNNIEKSCASYELREDLKELIQKKDTILNVSYTDYGGQFLDKVIISYFKENYSDNIIVEKTIYNGENAFIFGKVAREFFENTNDYFLGFEDLEEYYFNKITEVENDDFEYFLEDIKNDYSIDFDFALNWLNSNKSGYYSVTTQGIDFCFEDLVNELLKNDVIFKNSDRLYQLFIENDYTKDIAEYYNTQYENGTINELFLNEQTLNIINEFKNIAV